MSTHNMFSLRNKKNIKAFWLKKIPYLGYGYIIQNQNLQILQVFNTEALKVRILSKENEVDYTYLSNIF